MDNSLAFLSIDLQLASASALFLGLVSILTQPLPPNKIAPVGHTEKTT